MREGTNTHKEVSLMEAFHKLENMFSSLLNFGFPQNRHNRNFFLLVPLGAKVVFEEQ